MVIFYIYSFKPSHVITKVDNLKFRKICFTQQGFPRKATFRYICHIIDQNMKILWLDINSSYSHSSVALPAIHAQVSDNQQWEWCVVRGTINDNPGALAAAVAEHNPDVIAATFWLFTHQMQLEVLSRATQLLDNVKVICGGPEFLGDNEDFLRRNQFITAVIRGEGEEALPAWLDVTEKSSNINGSIPDEHVDGLPDCNHNYNHESEYKIRDLYSSVPGLCWIDTDGAYHDNGIARVADFAGLKYPEESPFFKWDKPFVQLETTRGCFNTCAFCVSGGEKPVRYQSLDQVRARLENIHAHGIKDIRVLDRTFNYDTARACEMLDIFTEYNDRMRFHLEIHPSLLSDALKDKLATLPKGLLHLEAGIQSLDSEVLAQSGRKGSLKSSLEGLRHLSSLANLETHADLIAGLPSYTLEMLCNDIATLVEIGVDELQIESLKVLPGTQMRIHSSETGLKFSPLPPYEILQTPSMTPYELKTAMKVSRMIDLYYNSPVWQSVTRNLIISNEGFIMAFTTHLNDIMVLDSPLSLERRGVILYEYCKTNHPGMLTEVSIAWIQAGCSLKKEPAGETVRIKNLEAFLETGLTSTPGTNALQLPRSILDIKYGVADPSHRYYLLTSHNRRILFGYDSLDHQPAPVFMAFIN
jgi:hypothetical protein